SGLGLAGVTFGLATLMMEILKLFFNIPVFWLTPVFKEAGFGWATIVLVTCVQPAVFEELAFRGVIQSGVQKVVKNRDAVIVSAFMFMIIHLSFASAVHLFVMGLILGWLRLKSGSLYPCMVLHFFHNLFCVLTENP